MVGGTANQQQQQPHQLAPTTSSSSSTAPTTTPEQDEILKRNTDCVYFLASPLTCKKGSECEYRHSDVARVNPRDCWYWLNGNCLNPKCAFRHPPLDGLLGDDISTPMGPTVPAPHAAPYAMPKQGVACIFFQKGFCLKGHLCPFLHGPPNPVNNKPAQSGPPHPVTEPPKKPIQEPKFTQQVTVQKAVESLLPQGKQPARNGAADKKVEPSKPARVVPPPVRNEKPSSKPNPNPNPNRGSVYHDNHHVSDNNRIMNGKDADEYSREPSPGFDVLVDTEVEDSEYYHNEDEIRRSRSQNHDIDRPIDYDADRDRYRVQRDYGHYNERDGLYPRNDTVDHYNESDLRHRLSKQRRASENGLRSVVSREYSQNHVDRMPRRDNHHHHDQRPDQVMLSSRLRGRIKIPGRSLSPTTERPLSLNQGRLRDRIKGNDDDAWDHKGPRGNRDIISYNDTKFAGPKRLSDLKPNDEQSLGKRKYPNENDLSFEGPKPLSEILKRKRGVEKDNNQKERETVIPAVSADYEAEKQTSSSKTEKEKPVDVTYDVNEVEIEEGLINDDDDDALLDEELEAYDDHREEDYEYEQMDGEGEEDYNLDEGEYVDEEEDGDGDGDEYGKKEVSVVYS